MRRLYNAVCYYLEVRAKQIYHDIYPPEHVEPEPAVPPQGAESQAELSGTRHLHDDALHSDQYRLARAGFTPGDAGQRTTTYAVPPHIINHRPEPPAR